MTLAVRGLAPPYELAGRAAPLVGRDEDLEALVESFRRCADTPGARAALVLGPDGAGKSALLRAFLERARAGDGAAPARFVAQASPADAGAPLGMLAQAVRNGLALPRDVDVEALRGALREAVAARLADDADRARVAALLGELVGADFPDDASPVLAAARHDPTLMRDQLREALLDLLRAECASRPVVLAFDDLDAGDLASARLVARVLHGLRDAPVFALGTARPAAGAALGALWSAVGTLSLGLAALPRDASLALLGALLPGATDAAEELAGRALGNALVLCELAREHAAHASPRAEGDRDGDGDGDSAAAVASRHVASLEPSPRSALAHAAALGAAFSRDALAAAIEDGSRAALPDALDALVRDGALAREPGDDDAYRFRHPLLAAAAYASLDPAARAQAHARAGRWLAARAGAEPRAVATHFDRAGEPSRAAPYHARDARRALHGAAPAEALAAAERARAAGADRADLAGVPRGALALLAAQAHEDLGRLADANAASREALDALPREGVDHYLAARTAARTAALLGDLAGVEDVLARLSDAPPDAPREAREAWAGARATLATQHYILGRYARAAELLASAERALDGAAGVSAPEAARVSQARSFRALYEGDTGAHIAHARDAAGHFQRVHNVRGALQLRVNAAVALLEVGAYAPAREALAALAEDALRHGYDDVAHIARMNLGRALAGLGRHDEAAALYEAVLPIFDAQRNLRFAGGSAVFLAASRLALGDLGPAEAAARKGVATLEPMPPSHAAALAMLAQVLRARGRTREALAAARRAAVILERLGGTMAEYEALLRLEIALCREAAGDAAGAREALVTARDRLLERAAKISDEALRASFLAAVPEHARTLALAEPAADAAPAPA